jgi:hypothetical protein
MCLKCSCNWSLNVEDRGTSSILIRDIGVTTASDLIESSHTAFCASALVLSSYLLSLYLRVKLLFKPSQFVLGIVLSRC